MIRYFLFILFFPTSIYCQFSENWNNNTFNSIPEWIGQTDLFTINGDSSYLYLNAPEGVSSAFLFTESKAIENAEWNFSIGLDFNPSSSNYCMVYLCSSSNVWDENTQGYYIKIGDTSDEVSLWKRKSGVDTKIIDGRDKILDTSSCSLNIRVTRDDIGNWVLYTKLGETEYIKEGEVNDIEIYESTYFGIYCKFTKTRRDKFHFGAISVSGQAYSDHIPPKIEQHQLIGGAILVLSMSEILNSETVVEKNVKVVGCDVGINDISLDEDLITVSFDHKVCDAENGAIRLSGFEDVNDNVIRDTIIYYTYFKTSRYDIEISEIMVDPSPEVELPNCEYVEVYNNSGHIINLDSYKLIINGKSSLIGDYILETSAYVLLVSESNFDLFDQENKISISGMGTMTNQEGEILLVDNENKIIDAITYPFSDLSESFKSEGGWSLEKKDLNNQDLSSCNWGYSLDLKGGTPGVVNSINKMNIDDSEPFVRFLSFIDDNNFKIHFSEAMDSSVIWSTSLGMDSKLIRNVSVDTIFLSSINVKLVDEMISNTIYSINPSIDITDLAGNSFQNSYTWRMGFPEKMDSFDLCINELMFNSSDGGVEFVEIYNRSNKMINVDDIYLTHLENDMPDKLFALNSNHQLIFPGDYIVVCNDTAQLQKEYTPIIKQQLIECDIPTLNNDGGNLAIVNKSGQVIDYLQYTEDMQFELLNSFSGVSLERLNYNSRTNTRNNWHSASAESGYATPTKVNSQFSDGQAIVKKDWIWLDDECFSPNSDGNKDYLRINYKMPEVGYSGTVKVYNKNGIPVQILADNILFSSEGFIQWDGIQSNHVKAPMGIYIIYVELFSTKGDVLKEKLVCVVNGGTRK